MAADTHLDADDEIAVGVRDFDRVDRVHKPQLFAFTDHHATRKAVDAGVRDVQVSQDANLAWLDDVLAKTGEIARTGAAGVDSGGDAGSAAEFFGVDAERRTAPVNM